MKIFFSFTKNFFFSSRETFLKKKISKNLTVLAFYCKGKYYKMEICLSKSLSICQLPRRISNAGMLSKAKKNYSQIEKGGLAITFVVKKFHQFIYRRHFMIQTDHKSLLGFLAENEPIPAMTSARVQRWAIILFGYDYTLSYHSGHQNSNADCMSTLIFNLERETDG